MNLLYLIWIPLLTALAILPSGRAGVARMIALLGAIAQLLMALALYAFYGRAHLASPGTVYFFESKYAWFPSWNISFHTGVDGISVAMILLTSLVVLAGVLVSWNMQKKEREYFFLLTLLALGAYGFFISLDLLLLFFFLEVAVIPKFLLIGIWGSGKKEASANKLALMLMAGSALVLVGILALYFSAGNSFDMVELAGRTISTHVQKIFFPFLFLGFGVFTAIFPFHTWVPDGHSSAPTAGSMFLAGISMKLGGYGCLKAAMYLMPQGAVMYADVIVALAAIAIIYGAFATMMQRDMKYMNAYSSISHCGFVLLGMGMLTRTAITGAVMQMVSHGLMTALFFAVIGMIYERTHTRQIHEMGGLMRRMPFVITVLYISGLCSLGLPGLSGFVAEMTVFVGSWEKTGIFHRVATVAGAMSIVVTAVYILKAVTKVSMGSLPENYKDLTDAGWNEKLAALVLIAGILAIGILPGWLNELVGPGSTIIMNRFNFNNC